MKTTKDFNEEFAKALITFFPAEAAYYCSLHNKPWNMYIYPIDKLSYVIKDYCDSTGRNGEDDTMKIFKLGLASKDCRGLFSPEPKCDCFIIQSGRIVFSNYKSIFADSFEEFGADFMTAVVIDWFVDNIEYTANNDIFIFFNDFKDEVSKIPGSKDILSKMSVNDVIDMAKITRRMLGRD